MQPPTINYKGKDIIATAVPMATFEAAAHRIGRINSLPAKDANDTVMEFASLVSLLGEEARDALIAMDDTSLLAALADYDKSVSFHDYNALTNFVFLSAFQQ